MINIILITVTIDMLALDVKCLNLSFYWVTLDKMAFCHLSKFENQYLLQHNYRVFKSTITLMQPISTVTQNIAEALTCVRCSTAIPAHAVSWFPINCHQSHPERTGLGAQRRRRSVGVRIRRESVARGRGSSCGKGRNESQSLQSDEAVESYKAFFPRHNSD